MDDGNVDTWHNHTYESCMLIVEKLLNVEFIFDNLNLIAHYNYNATPQKVKHSWLLCKYGAYKLPYMKHI
jgi:hypothetical protein